MGNEVAIFRGRCLLLLVLPALAGSFSARRLLSRGGQQRDGQQQQQQLGLLPISIDDAMQPGETRDVHFFEERFATCLEDAVSKNERCVGAMHFTDHGDDGWFAKSLWATRGTVGEERGNTILILVCFGCFH